MTTSTASGVPVERLAAARRRLGVPALGAALLRADGPAAVTVVGTRTRGGGTPATAADAWHIGSCGKSMAAALYARLVERGDAVWGAPVTELLGDVPAATGWSGITIDQVLVHRAGLRANLDRADLPVRYADERPEARQRTEVVAQAMSRPPHEAGRFVYSNIGYILVGAAIERLTGLTYQEALEREVLAPLGIRRAGWGPPPDLLGHRGRWRRAGLAVGRGRAMPPDEVGADNPPVMSPAGRLHLPLDEWCRFLRVFLVPGAGGRTGAEADDAARAFLAPATVERLVRPVAGAGRRDAEQAMGWARAVGLPGVSVGQQGSNTNWVATALLDPGRERAAVVVTNDGRTSLLLRTARLGSDLLRTRR